MPQILTIKDFGGWFYNTSDYAKPNQYRYIANMIGLPLAISGGYDYATFVKKAPALASFKTTLAAAGKSRGLFQYSTLSNTYIMAFQCTTDYTVGKLYALKYSTNTWYTLSTADSPYHATFAQFNDRVIMANGHAAFRKWDGDLTNWLANAPTLKDKGGTATAIAGATLTWNLTTTVTSDIDITTLISAGDWIRRSSTSLYWDEVKKVAAGGLSITLDVASSDNGASAAGGAQKVPDATTSKSFYPWFIKSWKNKLWVWGSLYSSSQYATLYWSVTADEENWSGDGSGSLDMVFDDGTRAAGIETIGDYLLLFKDNSILVYSWTGDLDSPIEFVKKIETGCVSAFTIANVGAGVIYLSNNGYHYTNGTEDINITGNIQDAWKTAYTIGRTTKDYYSLGSTDDLVPFAIYSPAINAYLSGTYQSIYYYDLDKKMWNGVSAYSNTVIGRMIPLVSSPDITLVNTFAITGKLGTATDQLRSLSNNSNETTEYCYLLSNPIDFGIPNKKKKVYWVDVVFGCDEYSSGTIYFNWWDYGETRHRPVNDIAFQTDGQLFAINGAGTYIGPIAATYYKSRFRKRFFVNSEMSQFGYLIWDGTFTTSSGWGIIEISIAYEVCETT